MLNDAWKKIKAVVVKQGEADDKKKIENIAFFIVVLIMTIFVINFIWNGNKAKQEPGQNQTSYKQLASTDQAQENQISGQEETNLKENLENILSNLNGARQSTGFVNLCREQSSHSFDQ